MKPLKPTREAVLAIAARHAKNAKELGDHVPPTLTSANVAKHTKNMSRYAWLDAPALTKNLVVDPQSGKQCRVIFGQLIHRSHLKAKEQKVACWAMRVTVEDANRVLRFMRHKAILANGYPEHRYT
jgi:hypothetical protein